MHYQDEEQLKEDEGKKINFSILYLSGFLSNPLDEFLLKFARKKSDRLDEFVRHLDDICEEGSSEAESDYTIRHELGKANSYCIVFPTKRELVKPRSLAVDDKETKKELVGKETAKKLDDKQTTRELFLEFSVSLEDQIISIKAKKENLPFPFGEIHIAWRQEERPLFDQTVFFSEKENLRIWEISFSEAGILPEQMDEIHLNFTPGDEGFSDQDVINLIKSLEISGKLEQSVELQAWFKNHLLMNKKARKK